MKNENILSEMTEIMEELLKYIPSKSTEEEITIEGYPPEKVTTTHIHHNYIVWWRSIDCGTNSRSYQAETEF